MIFFTFFLILSGSEFLKSYDILENDQYGALQRWGISRVKRDEFEQAEKINKKFPEGTLIVCDTAYQTEETPFTAIVLFRDSGRLLCMGSIVDERHILTAKRCYERSEASDLLVLLGYYKAYWGKWSQVKKVQKIVRHEFEVALLRLSSPISFTDYVQPTRLPPGGTGKYKFKDVFTGPFQVVGFMVDRFDVPGDYIKKDNVYKIKEDNEVKNFDDCKLNYTKISPDSLKMFCIIGNATYCWGGWGSPVLKLMSPAENPYWLQIGVVVADNCTADTTGPLLTARTDSYGDWIRGNSFHGHQPH